MYWPLKRNQTRPTRNGVFPIFALVIAALGMIAGCSPDAPLDNVPDPEDANCETSESTYENFGARFFQDYCLRCHSLTLETDLDRTDAPQQIDFDTLDMAKEFSNRIRLRAGALGDMPPRIFLIPRPDEAERRQLIEWIDCGMPSESDQAETP